MRQCGFITGPGRGKNRELENRKEVSLEYAIANTDRSVGAMLSGTVASRYGQDGLPEQTIQVKLMANTMVILFQQIMVMFSAITKMLLLEHQFGMKKLIILKKVTHSEIYSLL